MVSADPVKNPEEHVRIRAEDLPRSRRIMAFAMLLLGYFFYSYAWNTVDVLRPYIQSAADLTLQEVGWLYSAQSLGALVGAIILAQAADRLGRRNVLAAITICFGLALLAGVAADTLLALLGQRLLLGFFLGGIFSCTVGLYVGIFQASIRGRLASIVGVMFSLGLAFQGWLGSFLLDGDWEIMLWAGAIPPVLLGVIMIFVIPDDRRLLPWGGLAPNVRSSHKFPISELLTRGRLWITVRLALLAGLNFLAYQAFFGWATTYLREVRGLNGAEIGTVIGLGGLGAAMGGLFWGWVADRWGRRAGLIGFILAAGAIGGFVAAPNDLMLLGALYLLASALIAASVVWGPYFAELFPDHLRATAASIFNWGRIIGFFAPALTAGIAGIAGLSAVPIVGCAILILAAIIWITLPETLTKPAGEDQEG